MSQELVTETAAKLIANHDMDLGIEDMVARTCQRPVDRPTLVSSPHHFDNVDNRHIYSLDVIDLRKERHLLPPIDWLREDDLTTFRALGDRGLCLMEAELQKAVSGIRSDEIAFDQWVPQTLRADGRIRMEMVAI